MDQRPSDPDLSRRLGSLIFATVVAKSIYVAAKLRIADRLLDGLRPVEELARETDTDPDALCRVLRALAAEGLFDEAEPRMFAVTELGRLLAEETPGSRRADALMFGEQVDPVLAQLLESVQTGEPAGPRVFGKHYFDWLAENPEAAENFNTAMAVGGTARLPALLSLDVWQRAEQVVDVGGGNGSVLTALLPDHPALRGVVFDLPHVEAEAEATIAAAGLSDRCKFVGGSFFDSVPKGADVYLLLQILHDWNDADATHILHTCREAIRDDGRIVVVEHFIADERTRSDAAWLDVLMLVLIGGKERTEPEWRALFAAGGFELERITPGERAAAIEARPV